MSLATTGITPDVIREMMPPYHLSTDLLEATFAALPPPPPDASATWRHTRITRLVGEIAAFMPADAAQARLGAQIVVVRELADTLTARAHAPQTTIEQMCRLSRTAAELVRTAVTLERALAGRQQKPAPFFGTVAADGIDLAALDAAWCKSPMQQPATGLRPGGEAAPDPAARAAQTHPARPDPAPHQPPSAPPIADAERAAAATPRLVPFGRTTTEVPTRSGDAADPAACLPEGAGSPLHANGSGAAA